MNVNVTVNNAARSSPYFEGNQSKSTTDITRKNQSPSKNGIKEVTGEM